MLARARILALVNLRSSSANERVLVTLHNVALHPLPPNNCRRNTEIRIPDLIMQPDTLC